MEALAAVWSFGMPWSVWSLLSSTLLGEVSTVQTCKLIGLGYVGCMAWLSRNKKPSSGDAQIALPAAGATDVARPGSDAAAPSAEASDLTEGGALPEMGRFGPKVAVTRLEAAPPELEWQLPLNGELYKLLPGPDRPDYSVMVLERPLLFYPAESFDLGRLEQDQRTEDRRGRPMVRVHALLLCARFVGQQLHPGMSDLAVNLAYVIDNSLARDEVVDFAKIEYAAVGSISEGHREAAPASDDAAENSVDNSAADAQPGANGAQSAVGVDATETTGSIETPDGAGDERGPGAGGPDQEGAASSAGFEPATLEEEGHTSTEVEEEGIEPGDLAEDGPPPEIVMSQVTQEAARTLRDGIAEQRGTQVENITATLALDEQHRVIGLSGNADGQPPVPTPDTFERLNAVLALLNDLPANHAVKGLTLRVEGNALSSDVEYRN